MKIVRRGNNILINWYVTNLGVPMDFSGKKVEVRLLDKYNTMCLFDYTIAENVITGTFYGKDQITPGPYHLLLICDAGKKGQIMLDSREIFGIRECLPDGTSVGGEHVADVVEVRVDSNINSLVGLCLTKLYYKDGADNDPGEEHEYNLLDVEIVVPEGYTGTAATIYSKQSIDKLIADNVKGLEDRMDNIHEEVNNQKLDITEYNANREADKAELEAYKADKAREFEEHVAGFEKYKLDHKAEMTEELAKKANKAETEVILNTKADKVDVTASESALQSSIDTIKANLDLKANKAEVADKDEVDLALDTKANKVDVAASISDLQSKIDSNKSALDTHVANAKVTFDAHVEQAKKDLDAHVADFVEHEKVFETYKEAAKKDLDTHVAQAKKDLDAHVVDYTNLKNKVDDNKAEFDAHAAEFTTFKTNNQTALDAKANKTDVETSLSGKVDNATFEAYKVSNQAALDTKANKTDLASSEADIQSKIDNINTSLDSHKSDFEAHKSAALVALDTKANKTDVETSLSGKVDNSTFDAYKVSNQTALDAKADKTDVETALSGKVDNTTFEAHKDTYETFKTNTEVALNSKADIANTYNKAEVDTKILNAVTGNVDVYTKTEIDTKLTGMVKVQKLTQAEYDALATKDENVLYAIIEPTPAG